MTKVNVMIGRFQPFTMGHMKCIEQAWKELKVPTIICMINTPDEKVDERKPFPSSLLVPLYETEFKGNKMIEGIELVRNANIVEIGEKLYESGYEICSWTCGTDRYESYKNMSTKYHDQAHLSDDFKMIEVKRGDEDISATKVRRALLDDDKKTFDKLTPFHTLKAHLKGDTSVYEALKNQINKVMNK